METLYATAANFGCSEDEDNSSRPWVIQSVSVPVSIKRKWPSKHYVYKVAVQWSNGTSTVIYRRYSLFFDFLVKLQELVSSLAQTKTIDPSSVQLPELPGKGLFSRRQTHQVAEKRRNKIEEFCQQLIVLPPEISESNLVLGFFNTWPDDTMPKESEPVITAPIITSPTASKHKPLTSTLSTQSLDSPTSPPPNSPPVSDAVISHPDEMEHLEQYQVLANYQRMDSHQVNLFAGQVVHVIEKHDTGWWMVMTEDEQGYAPAAYLETLEESTLDRYPENATNEVYEAMETYVADGDDEVGFRAGDRIEVITKSMDGWWKIRCNGKVGYSPAALIRRKAARPSNKTLDFVYESEKTIYEELNIHKPPPRRNTIDKSILRRVTPRIPPGYDSPRTNNFLASKQDEQIYVEPANEDSDNEDNIYKVPRSISDQPNVNGSISPYATINHNQSTEPLDTSTRKESTNSVSSPKLHRLQEKICQFIPDASNSTLHKDPEPIYESTESLNDDGSDSPVYENTDFDAPHTPQRSPLPDAVTSPQPYITPENNRHKPRRHTPDDYEDLDNLEETFSASDREPSDDYEVMDGKVKEQIKRPTRVRASPKSFSSSQSFDNTADDYEDMDSELAHRNSIAPLLPALDDYVAMDPKASVISSPRETAAPFVGSKGQQSRKAVPLAWRIANSSAIEGILKKRLHGTHSTSALLPPSAKKCSSPPANTSSETTIPKSRFPFTKCSSVSCVQDQDVFEDEYIEMDPIYTMPPPEEIEEEEKNNSSEEATTKGTSPSRPISSRPLPPPPYALIETKPPPSKSQSTSTIIAPTPKQKLTRAKSVENFLSSPSREDTKVTRQLSPPAQQPKKSNRVPPLPPPRVPLSKQLSSPGLDSVDGAMVSRGGNAAKPLPGRVWSNNKPGKPFTNGHVNREGSPENPCDLPPIQKPRVGTPGREFSPAKRSVSPPNLIPSNEREGSPHRPLIHTVSEPQMKQESAKMAGVNFPKTYIAKYSYASQTEGCLSFSAGDKCVLVSQTRDGWWLVNIGGREGWTPGDFWDEDVRNRATIASRPPSFAPKKLPEVRKPRSHTVATDNPSSLPELPELPTTKHPSVDSMWQDNPSSSLLLSSNTEKEKSAALSSSMELLLTKNPLKPPPYSKTGKAKCPPPPKPRPLQNSGLSPGIKRKPPVPQKPTLPQKPTNVKTSPHVSPTPPVGQPANATPSPPPPLPPANFSRKRGSQDSQINHDMAMSAAGNGLMVDGEYVMLKDAITSHTDNIESAPWFVGKMDRGQAEQFLMEHGRQREFLVRERTAKEGFYALSIRHHYSCKHFNIDPTHDRQYSMGTLMFSTIDEIIQHYQQNSLFIHDGQHVTLGQPVKRRVRHSDAPKSNANVFC